MKDFYKPRFLIEALERLDQAAGEEIQAKLIAGGTDLIIALRERKISADLLIDISDLTELKSIFVDGDYLHIGAGVSFSRIETDPLIRMHCNMLAQSAGTVGAPAIRTRSTMGGNVANGAAAADAVPVLLAADALVRIASYGGERTIPVEALFLATSGETLKSGDILVEFLIPIQPGTVTGFEKIGKRKALAIARINLGMVLKLEENSQISKVSLAIGCVGKKGYRVRELEGWLVGKTLNQAVCDEASERLEEIVERNLNGRKTAPYKKQIAKAVLSRALSHIMEEA